jgi:AcrR family transcriptional regulator
VSTELPPGIAAAWGVLAAMTKGPRPKLTVEAIVAAGIATADEEGLEAVSMNRVAKRLGSSPMGLYRYVGSKEELLELMVDAALGPMPEPPPAEGWRAGLERCARWLADAMRAHPWSTHVPVPGPPVTPNAVAWLEAALASLRDTGLAEGEKASVALMLSGYVREHVMLMADVEANFLDAASSPDDAMRGYVDLLRGLVGGERFPALQRALDAGVFDRADPPDEELSFGLDRILDGVEALVRRSG